MRLALIQTEAGPDRENNLARALSSMERASEAGANLVVFPELALDRFFPQYRVCGWADSVAESIPGPTSDRIASRAGELSLVTVFNLYERSEDGRTFDSSPVFDSDGSLLGVTRMVHITDYEGFHEQAWYHPGDTGAPVFDTAVGRIGVAICYDRHYPEYMRALGAAGAELVCIPQAGTAGEWPEGMFEAEVRATAFQNGYFAALCNRTGADGGLMFAGESFVSDPEGKVVARGASGAEDLILCDIDLSACSTSTARRLFWRDRRPGLYGDGLFDRSTEE
ncbi:MAG: carbon-nitrogen hydrolase family protein [Gemmatimonadota bacterium]